MNKDVPSCMCGHPRTHHSDKTTRCNRKGCRCQGFRKWRPTKKPKPPTPEKKRAAKPEELHPTQKFDWVQRKHRARKLSRMIDRWD